MHQYFVLYKPFQVLSQFTSQEGKQTLGDHFDVPRDVYPVGRLDYDSEGLLILTNDPKLNHALLDPSFSHEREYWVQVEGAIDTAGLSMLETGTLIAVDGKPYRTKKSVAEKFSNPPAVPTRHPDVRFRKNIPTSWIRLVLTEGKNRQVRKMTAKAGHPTLRLIRIRIENLVLPDLQPGAITEMTAETLFPLLFYRKDR